jgi:hypothetical protein
VILEDAAQAAKVQAIRDRCPAHEPVIVIDGSASPRSCSTARGRTVLGDRTTRSVVGRVSDRRRSRWTSAAALRRCDVMTAVAQARTHRKSRRAEAARELALFALAYLTYFGVRAVTEGSVHRALANAAALFRLEADLGVAWESALQRAVLRHGLLVDVANAVYMFGHWPVILVAGVLLFRYRRGHYYRLRNTFPLSAAFGLVIFALLPVAPPRLTGVGVVDTVTAHAGRYRQLVPASLVNQYAAMPSFHAGWNLVVGVVLFQATRVLVVRVFAILMPMAMALAVVVTANHFVVDVVAGVLIASAALVAVQVHERGAEPRTLVRDERDKRGHGRQRAGRPVRGGASRGERSGALASR